MVDRDALTVRLQRLDQYLRILRGIGERGLPVFLEDPLVHGAAERYLQLSIETLIDIGNHLIADRGYRRPESYADVFAILTEASVIEADLARQLEGLAGFRNLLVHDYLRIDLDRVYRILHDKLPTLERLAAVFARSLDD